MARKSVSNAWIKMRKALADDRRVHAIAAACRIHWHAVIGKLFVLWAWADGQADGEDVEGLTLGWINAKVEQSGFAEELCKVGWIATTATGFKLLDFSKHNWQAGKTKALAAKRQGARRERCHANSHAPSVTEALPEASQKRDPPTPTPLNTPLPPSRGEERGQEAGRQEAPEPASIVVQEGRWMPADRPDLHPAAMGVCRHYEQAVGSDHRQGHAVAAVVNLLAHLVPEAALRDAAARYGEDCARKDTPRGKRQGAGTFYARDGWRLWLQAMPAAVAPPAAPLPPRRKPTDEERAAMGAALRKARQEGKGDGQG